MLQAYINLPKIIYCRYRMEPTRKTTRGNLQGQAKKPAPPARRKGKTTARQARQAVAQVGLNQTDMLALVDIVVSRLEGSMKSHVEKLVAKQLEGRLQQAGPNGDGSSQGVWGMCPQHGRATLRGQMKSR